MAEQELKIDASAADIVYELIPKTQSIISDLQGSATKFDALNMYGSLEFPLFIIDEVGVILGHDRLRIRSDKYELGTEYLVVRVNAVTIKNGVVEKKIKVANVLTELGLYTLIFNSRSPIAAEFRLFVYTVLRRLRLDQSITLKQAQAEFKELREKYDRDRKDHSCQLNAITSQLVKSRAECAALRPVIGLPPDSYVDIKNNILIALLASNYPYMYIYVVNYDYIKDGKMYRAKDAKKPTSPAAAAADILPPFEEAGEMFTKTASSYDMNEIDETYDLDNIYVYLSKRKDLNDEKFRLISQFNIPNGLIAQLHEELSAKYSTSRKQIYETNIAEIKYIVMTLIYQVLCV